MRSVIPMKTAKGGYIIVSLMFCILGITLIVFPEFSAELLGQICGSMFLLFGCVKLIGYFSKDLFRLAFQFDLEFGILMIVLGIVILAHPGSLRNFICITFGVAVLGDGLFKIRIALDAKRFGIEKWWLTMVTAVLTSGFGLLLVCSPLLAEKLLMIFLGIALLAEGILSMSTVITMVKIIRHQHPDEYMESEDEL